MEIKNPKDQALAFHHMFCSLSMSYEDQKDDSLNNQNDESIDLVKRAK